MCTVEAFLQTRSSFRGIYLAKVPIRLLLIFLRNSIERMSKTW